MKHFRCSLFFAFALFPSACTVATADDEFAGEEVESAEEAAIQEDAAMNHSLVSRPIAATLAAATLVRTGLSDPFDDAEVDRDASTVNTPKPPWPATCNALAGHSVSVGLDGPDGGTCTIKGTTSNCRQTGDTCTCDLTGETRSGDCKDDGSKTTFDNPAETQGLGL